MISQIESEIIDQYLYDENPDRPWIIGFSGGKDSTALLQVVWYALKKVPAELRWPRDIYVVCNDTLVENPKVVDFVDGVLNQIEKEATSQSMPIYVIRTKPKLEDTFWLNVIGKGYPAPNKIFRWCTERLKINPTTRFIQEKVSEKGEVIILLGTREAESGNRARSMKKHEKRGKRLRNHVLRNASVFPPIKDMTTDEVWEYLMAVPSPWGSSNKVLAQLYRNANSGDCPLVIDTTTASCGNSRFGCWVCTVVKRDKSMEALIENGEPWMYPLLELRDYLADSRDSEEHREKRRRNGKITEGMLGPYNEQTRATILRMLLAAQKEIQAEQPEMNFITHQEMVAIQANWYRDGYYTYKVADIYNEIYDIEIDMDKKYENLKLENDLLKEAVAGDEEKFNLLNGMLATQKTKTLLLKKRGLLPDLEHQIDVYLRKKDKSK
jgi:DNA sulfur modification protein DndC